MPERQPISVTSSEAPAALLSVIIPCLNEAENIEQCVKAAWGAIALAGMEGEVIVADNGSEDGSAELREPQARASSMSRARLRQRVHRRVRSRSRHLHRDGGRRPDIRLH